MSIQYSQPARSPRRFFLYQMHTKSKCATKERKKKKEKRRKQRKEREKKSGKTREKKKKKTREKKKKTRDERREKEIRILVENHNVTQRRHTRQQTRTMNTVGMKCNVRAARVANKQNAR